MSLVELWKPISFRLSGSHLVREPPRIEAERQEGYIQAFDSRTVFYDAHLVGDTLTLIAPPLRNLAAHLRIEAGGILLPWKRISQDRSETIIARVPASTNIIGIRVGTEDFEVRRQDCVERPLPLVNERVLQTLSLNNPIEWIVDWVNFYCTVHGTTALLLYDNGSTAYDLDTLQRALEERTFVRRAVVVAWDFPYGPGGGPSRTWDSDYCQHGSFEHSRRFITSAARSLVNTDVDEFVLTPASLKLHTIAEASPLGGVNIPGVWVEALRQNPQELPRFTEFAFVKEQRRARRSPPKWAVVPARLPHWVQLRTHKLRRWALPTLPGTSYRHFRGLSSMWRQSSAGWGYTPTGETEEHQLIIDRRLARQSARWRAASAGRITSLQSSRSPGSDTNPFLRLMGDSLETQQVSVVWFSWRNALLRSWDVLHLHWPENLIAAKSAYMRIAKIALFRLLLLKLQLSKARVVYTVHNARPHEPLRGNDGRRLERLLRTVDVAVLMTPMELPPGVPANVRVLRIPHGTYRPIMGNIPARPNERKRVLMAGLIRPYKRVPEAVAAFSLLTKPTFRLRVVGRASDELRDRVVAARGSDERISLELRYVDDKELVREFSESDLLVLNYENLGNSGVALMALSAGVPVLMPRCPAGEGLLAEVGDRWICLFDGRLTPEDIELALATTSESLGGGSPALPERSWESIARSYVKAYQRGEPN